MRHTYATLFFCSIYSVHSTSDTQALRAKTTAPELFAPKTPLAHKKAAALKPKVCGNVQALSQKQSREVPEALLRSSKRLTSARYDNSSEDECSPSHRHHSPPPVFASVRTRAGPLVCAKCDEIDCNGCACMCQQSTEWHEHDGGHFFPTCTACGGQDCPGCQCICPKSRVLTEHGGHFGW